MSEHDEADEEEGCEDPRSLALGQAIDRVFVQTERMGFDHLVELYDAIKADFVDRFADDEFLMLETKRRIAERILITAIDTEQSFDVCRQLWGALLRLGFTDVETACTMSCYYARCCLRNREIEEGIQVLEPLQAEFERCLADPTTPKQAVLYYSEELGKIRKLLTKLSARK